MMLGWLMNFRIFIYRLTYNKRKCTFDIIFLFLIFFLLIILTATLMPVRSCLASKYIFDLPLTLANPPAPIVFPSI